MMPTTAKAVAAVQKVIDITNACLYVLGKKSERNKFEAKIVLPNNSVYEETIVEQM